ncbi:RagB/SusD family nutrient uptake outer membrane protein [Pedobacter sandarakinus]|uniref:RagB/SusD family nutrient uptake outer membrane protein n=1 Tax=Pedobacter sandarakinus TaxID=353156 RepID=UPI0022458762|nr:RagB/SusD family nutrient uptake outer membrane protein [Pedobacter sandarakinus]MCX2574121.1 RagB/SusD family nutrient uptake outer membrane protein [Pedobacter sandarakinus]
MNRFLQIIFCVSFTLGFVSCKKQSFLDPQLTGLSEKDVFTDSTRTMNFLTNIYTDVILSQDTRRFGETGLAAATDEAEGPLNSSNYFRQFVSGSVNPNNITSDVFTASYEQIRAVNQFLKNLSTSKFDAAQRRRTKGEAIFLRAWYYSMLLKHYGGVPIVGDELYGRTDDIPTVRSSYANTVKYVVDQCDTAEKYLLLENEPLNYGRATRGAALALKARVLLYAASPLFNDPGASVFAGSPVKNLVSYDAYDANRWKTAADAALAVMNLNKYKLREIQTVPPETRKGLGFVRMFYENNAVNDEFIFRGSKPGGAGVFVEQDFNPPSRGGRGNLNGTYPYQELVDAFPSANGKAIDDPTNTTYDANNPYLNRDPRLDYTVMRNEAPKHTYPANVNLPVYTYFGAPNDGIYVGTSTGYYPNKMLRDSAAAYNLLSGRDQFFPLIRYAEVMLNYAEATNEFSGPSATIYDMLTRIRKRAGILPGTDNNYGLKPNMSKDEMRKAIQLERRIELAFEEHRFWDVRRWKIAEDTENRPMNGMEIRKVGNGYTYKKVFVRQHVFSKATYLWPFPQREVSKPGGLIQNPGY